MGELAAQHLLNNGAEKILVANRTFERGLKLAEQFGGKAVRFEELSEQLKRPTSSSAPPGPRTWSSAADNVGR